MPTKNSIFHQKLQFLQFSDENPHFPRPTVPKISNVIPHSRKPPILKKTPNSFPESISILAINKCSHKNQNSIFKLRKNDFHHCRSFGCIAVISISQLFKRNRTWVNFNYTCFTSLDRDKIRRKSYYNVSMYWIAWKHTCFASPIGNYSLKSSCSKNIAHCRWSFVRLVAFKLYFRAHDLWPFRWIGMAIASIFITSCNWNFMTFNKKVEFFGLTNGIWSKRIFRFQCGS